MDDPQAKVAGQCTTVPTKLCDRPYINLDNAASTPPLLSVMEAVNNFMPWYSSVHRGSGLKSRRATDLYEEARTTAMRFFGANADEHVTIFTKNATEAINKLSYRLGLRKKDIVLISHLEHHSNDLPWRARATVKRIGLTADGGIDRDDFLRLLDQYKGRIKLVALSGASNVTGFMPDIHWYARTSHQYGAQILIDAAQLAAHRTIDMKHLDDPEHLDYIALSAHKMYAPFGSGALIGRKDTFARGEPEYRGGGTVQIVTTNTVDWALPPDSDEAGSPNVVGAIALAQAIRTLQTIGLDNITRHETELTAYTLRQLPTVPGLTLYGNADPKQAGTRSGVISFTLDGFSPHLVAAVLGFEHGIGVRSGCFCAHPYVFSLLTLNNRAQQRIRRDILHGQRGHVPGMVRISIGLYNTFQDIDRTVAALRTVRNTGLNDYAIDKTTGFYTPLNNPETYTPYFN